MGAARGPEGRGAEVTPRISFFEEQARVYSRPDDIRAWTEFAHVLFNLKEFIFVN